jgi:carbonic anhydrase
MGNLTALLAKIQPAVFAEDQTKENRSSGNAAFVENVAEINVKRNVNEILERSVILKEMAERGEIGLIGGMYDVASGQVEFYEDTKVLNKTEALSESYA